MGRGPGQGRQRGARQPGTGERPGRTWPPGHGAVLGAAQPGTEEPLGSPPCLPGAGTITRVACPGKTPPVLLAARQGRSCLLLLSIRIRIKDYLQNL